MERQDTAGSQFLAYGNGFIKYSNDGAIYTDANDEVYWNQTYEMKEPMADVCEDYVALADKGGTEIYIMNQAGMQGKIETPMNISRISVANQGVVAVWMESDERITSVCMTKMAKIWCPAHSIQKKRLSAGYFPLQ